MVFFGYYLAERGLITSAQVLEALDRQRADMIPIGKLARKTGKLTEEQVCAILNQQQSQNGQGRKPFGQIAKELGVLNEHDIVTLIEEQIYRRKPIGDILVEMGAIGNAAMSHELAVFLGALGDE